MTAPGARPAVLPDVVIVFDGSSAGYGRLARRLLELEEGFRALRVASLFRCRRSPRRLALDGNLPLSDAEAVVGLSRFGCALGMQVMCSVHLPDNACRHSSFSRLAAKGGISGIVLDLSSVPGDAERYQANVAAWLTVARRLHMQVEVRSTLQALVGSGVLRGGWLDEVGVTVRPVAAGHSSGASDDAPWGELCVAVDGRLYRGEGSWRRGEDPLGSIYDDTQAARSFLRRLVLDARAARQPVAEVH